MRFGPSIGAMIKKLNIKEHVLIVVLGVAGILGVSLTVTYFLAAKHIDSLRTELSGIENQIQQTEVSDVSEPLGQRMNSLEEKSLELDSKFPAKEEEALRFLSDFAKKSAMDVISSQFQSRKDFLQPPENKKIEAAGKTCQSFLLTMEMKGSYKDFLEYLASLKKSLPAYMTVERLKMIKDPSGAFQLNITVDLNLYLLT